MKQPRKVTITYLYDQPTEDDLNWLARLIIHRMERDGVIKDLRAS